MLLAACGSSPSKGGATANSSSAGATKGAAKSPSKSGAKSTTTSTPALACATGTAASGVLMTVAQEPDQGVSTPKGQCWAKIPYTSIAKLSTGTPPAGAKAQFKAAWNSQNLYILAYVQKWPLYDANAASTHDDDTVEFYLAGDHKFASSYDSVDCQYNVVYTGTVSQTTTCNTGLKGKPVTQVVQGTGYYDELVVPWTMLGIGAPAKGQEYAFSIAVDMASSSGHRLAQVEWAGGANNDWSETADWGSITLG